MEKGDRVLCPDGYTGVITYVGYSMYSIRLDNPDLIPNVMDYPKVTVMRLGSIKKCECGGGKESYDHLKFCPSYKSGYDDFE
jgi:hypothetical protein